MTIDQDEDGRVSADEAVQQENIVLSVHDEPGVRQAVLQAGTWTNESNDQLEKSKC